MLIVHVHIHVKPEFVEAFKKATIENARNSILEAGIARFDVIQNADDPTRFILQEVYRTDDAPARHKETAHYAAWRDAATPMMVETRTSVKYANVFPPDDGWVTRA
jgi:(4S)-4-hydroxy-5-phosphonooxypentane-2,3-dione isomerase